MISYQALPLMLAATPLVAAAGLQSQALRSLSQEDGPSSPLTETITLPTPQFRAYNTANPAQCSKMMAGCTGTLTQLQNDVAGEITVIDDCTFRVQGWEYDGEGPAVEWWVAAPDVSSTTFDYENGVYAATIQDNSGEDVVGAAAGGPADITVRMGVDASGERVLLTPTLTHISVWCEGFTVDFGNAVLECPPGAGAGASGPASSPGAAEAPGGAGPAPAGTDPASGDSPVGAPDADADGAAGTADGSSDAGDDDTDARDTVSVTPPPTGAGSASATTPDAGSESDSGSGAVGLTGVVLTVSATLAAAVML